MIVLRCALGLPVIRGTIQIQLQLQCTEWHLTCIICDKYLSGEKGYLSENEEEQFEQNQEANRPTSQVLGVAPLTSQTSSNSVTSTKQQDERPSYLIIFSAHSRPRIYAVTVSTTQFQLCLYSTHI